jgi:limonene-1,2-epoxide hydrolase
MRSSRWPDVESTLLACRGAEVGIAIDGPTDASQQGTRNSHTIKSVASEVVSEQVAEQESHSSPIQLVERFLDLMSAKEIDGAMELLSEDVEYANVGLPTVRGRERVRRLGRATLGMAGAGFEVYVHAISASGSTVLTERTDVLKFRRLRAQFWVCGRFDVRDGQIVLWRDYFDQANVLPAFARGLLGVIVPAVRAKPPIA